MSRPTDGVAVAASRGAPPRRLVVRAVLAGAAAQLAVVALVGGATGLFVWAARRPGLGAVAGLLVAVELVAFLRAPLRHAERLAAHDLGLDGLAGWRTWLLDAVATWSPSRLASARTGDLLSRCLEDVDALQDLWVRSLVPAAATMAALLVAGVLLAVLEPTAGLAVLVASLAVGALAWARAARVARLGADEASLRGAATARTVELAHGAAALALLGADGAHLEAIGALVADADGLAARREAAVAQTSLVAALVGAAAFVAAVLGAPLSGDPALAAGVVLAVLACAELVQGLPDALDALGPVAGAAERLASLAEPIATGTVDASRGELALRDLDVAIGTDGPALLVDVDLAVAPGSRVAVLGPTGAGKSSLLAVAAGLEPPRRGEVRLAGEPLGTLEEASLRRRLAWLPTHPGLLEGRVRDVLDLGRGLDDDALVAALDAVGLTELLAARGGLDAVLAERAEDLSGGERRRLALARLLAGGPDVYVLDEPTAGLDEASAAAALDALWATDAAVLVATHDPRVAARASARVTVVDGSVR